MYEHRYEGQQGEVQRFNVGAFSRDALIYSAGQSVLFIIGAIQGLLVPKLLSIQDYGYFQMFILYTSYSGLLHLGFVDGALVRWVSKDKEQVAGELKSAALYLAAQLLVIILPLLLVFFFLLHSQNQVIAISALIYAFVMDFGYIFIFALQATKRFKVVTAANIAKSVLIFGIVIICLLTGLKQYYFMILAILIGHFIFDFIMVFIFRRDLKVKPITPISFWQQPKLNLNIGFFILAGNFIVLLFMTLDRLTINALFSVEQFAVYSLAMSVVMITYLFVSAISQVLLPYLASIGGELRTKTYQLAKPSIIIAWCGVLAIYFPFVWIVRLYLPQYVASLQVLAILLCTVGFGSIIQILQANYFMIYRKQRPYFYIALSAFAILALLIVGSLVFFKTLPSIAVATLIGYGFWFIGNEAYLSKILKNDFKSSLKDSSLVIITLVFIFVSSIVVSVILQFLLYVLITAGVLLIMSKKELRELIILANFVRKEMFTRIK
jgi:O-antigen/teichoic acid export membrane protein